MCAQLTRPAASSKPDQKPNVCMGNTGVALVSSKFKFEVLVPTGHPTFYVSWAVLLEVVDGDTGVSRHTW